MNAFEKAILIIEYHGLSSSFRDHFLQYCIDRNISPTESIFHEWYKHETRDRDENNNECASTEGETTSGNSHW